MFICSCHSRKTFVPALCEVPFVVGSRGTTVTETETTIHVHTRFKNSNRCVNYKQIPLHVNDFASNIKTSSGIYRNILSGPADKSDPSGMENQPHEEEAFCFLVCLFSPFFCHSI